MRISALGKDKILPFCRRIVCRAATWEILAAIAFVLWFCLKGRLWAGGPRKWDELLYMDLSLTPVPDGIVLNRFFHIYFQKLFMGLAGDAIKGAQLFWCFEIASIIVLIYFIAARIAPVSRRMVGLIAVLFFCGHRFMFTLPGVTYADLTVTLMIMAAIYLYLIAADQAGWRRIAGFAALGATCFFAFKSKDIGVISLLTIAGLGWREKKWSARRWVKDLGCQFGGLLLGCIALAVLDGIFLRDCLFSFRPSSFRSLVAFNAIVGTSGRFNWVDYFARISLPLVVLYAMSARVFTHSCFSVPAKTVWFFPMAVLLMLTFGALSHTLVLDDRYLYPVVPPLCVCAALALAKPFRAGASKLLKHPGVHAAFGAIAAVAAYFVAEYLAKGAYLPTDWGWSPANYHQALLEPASLCALMGLLAWASRWNPGSLFAALGLLWILGSPTLNANWADLTDGKAQRASQARFTVFSQIKGQLPLDDHAKYYLSLQTLPPKRYPTEYELEDRSRWLFNVFYNSHVKTDQWKSSDKPADFMAHKYDCAILTRKDWSQLEPFLDESARKKYVSKALPGDLDMTNIVLLASHDLARKAGWAIQQPTDLLQSIRATTNVFQLAAINNEYATFVGKTPETNEAMTSQAALLLAAVRPLALNDKMLYLGYECRRVSPSIASLSLAFYLKKPMLKDANLTVIGVVKPEHASYLIPEWRPHQRAVLFNGLVGASNWKPGEITPVVFTFVAAPIPYDILFSFQDAVDFPETRFYFCGTWSEAVH
ncbi:MAG: hypothetical protein NTX50_04360 [Candidatus Sumerlaeota bacterium]|nr:hypothetical protein [Candidatus Sumerlaeota bacterium]